LHNFAHRNAYLSIFVLGVFQIVYTQDARTHFGAKYVKKRGVVQGCAAKYYGLFIIAVLVV